MSFLGGIFRKGRSKPSRRSLCPVCNDFQITTNDLKSTVTPRWDDLSEDGVTPRLTFPPNVNPMPPAMMILDILPRRIAEVRDRDPTTGLPIRNCKYCALICDAMDRFFSTDSSTVSIATTSTSSSTSTAWLKSMDPESEFDCQNPPCICLHLREGSPLVITCLNFLPNFNGRRSRIDLEILLPTAPDALEPSLDSLPLGPTIGTAAPRASDPSLCAGFIQECFTECIRDHKFCQRQHSSFVPTRLVYLGGSDHDIHLVEYNPSGFQVSWVALSYCRGATDNFQLTQNNKAQCLKRIDYAALPAVFIDAMKVTRFLGLSYIWIDALCILQDQQQDWEFEVSQMGEIYSNAFVILAAASSPNPSVSFLAPRDSIWKPHVVNFLTDDGDEIPLVIRRRSNLATPVIQGIFDPPFTASWATLRREGPLYTRAWAFQEIYLPVRTIHFSPGAIVFECQTHRRSEDQRPPYTCTIANTLGKVSEAAKWKILVKMYSQRKLRYNHDRLIGISGLASKMEQAATTQYVAGLWADTFVFDLLWQSIPGSAKKPTACRKDEQKAPSWSWASVNCGVTWHAMKNPQPQALVVDIEVITNPSDRYGAVLGGNCILNTPILPIVITTSRNQNEQNIQYRKGGGMLSKKMHFWADGQLVNFKYDELQSQTYVRRSCEGELEEDVEASGYFVLLTYMNWMNTGYAGLVVSACPDSEGSFSRVGVVTHLYADWAEKARLNTIKIV